MFSVSPSIDYALRPLTKTLLSFGGSSKIQTSERLLLTDTDYDDLAATYISAVAIAFTIFYDITVAITLPGSLRRIINFASAPFHNFLEREDLEEFGKSKPIKRSPSKSKQFLLVFLPFLQALLKISLLSYNISSGDSRDTLRYVTDAFAWSYASWRTWCKPPTTPPYLLFIFYSIWVLSASSDILSCITDGQYNPQATLAILTLLISLSVLFIIGTYPLKDVLPSPYVATGKETPSHLKTMPEDSVTLWQWCTFSFVEPIFKVAVKRRLEHEDVWSLSPFFKHKNLFLKYLDYRERHPKRSLVWFLIASNSLDLILDVVLELWSATAGFIPVYALQKILTILADDSRESNADAFYYAFLTFVVNLSFAQVDLFQSWHSRRSYERARGQLFCALHYKALKRRDLGTTGTRAQTTNNHKSDSADLGKIVNLMQGDAYTVSLRFWQASLVFALTVRLIISLVFLYQVLGWSSMAGVVVVVVAYVVNFPLAKYNVYITRESWKAKDLRMSGVNELFQNIRFLKFYGWENLWASRSLERREVELQWRVKENVVAILISFIWIWVPSAMALFSFLFYTIVAGGRLTVAKTFTSLALFSSLQSPMMELPDQFFSFLHAYVSLQRINTFLQEDEVDPWASDLMRSTSDSPSKIERLGFEDARFGWNAENDVMVDRHFQLGPLNLDFPLGQISLITGATGSGKSTLLAALLGEMYCLGGRVYISKSNHQIAYCAQNPWLEHATIRDNIIFGSDRVYDETRYRATLDACALQRDLQMFEAGDMTEIGEKGVTLSGGQRARVALARALYSEASVLLLDDPLAAVDMHTAHHIVEHCLQGPLMRGRTVLLVTHHISLCLRVASYIVELSGGTVIRSGLIRDLKATGELKTVIDAEDEPFKDDENPTITQEVVEEELLSEVSNGAHVSTGKLVEAEHRAEGRVSLRTYITYIRAAGWVSWLLTLSLMLLIRGIAIASDLFLAKWSEAFEERIDVDKLRLQTIIFNTMDRAHIPILRSLPPPAVDTKPWLMIYLWISLAGAIATLTYISLGYYASLQASRKLFRQMIRRLVRAPSRFFDVTPIGRILNRFTSDMNTVDSTLQQSVRAALTGGLTFVASFLFIIWIVPQFAPFAILIAWLYIRIAPPYVQAARDLRRLESVSLSPAFAGFDELLRGLSHVRAFAMEKRYQDSFYAKVDLFQGFDHVYWLVAGWLRWRYDCLGSVVVYVTTLFALWSGVSAGFAAIVIVQAGIFAEASRQLVKVAAQLELDFNSVERIGEYLQTPQEAPSIIEEKRPPAYWPTNSGKLIVQDLEVRYAPDLPPVLNGVSFTVSPSEKIGVVGRTGSGKSTLALSLLRIIEPCGGSIILDGIDITSIGLEDLRTKITIVSQDVSLFTGTIRSNLDPFGDHADEECLDALSRCHLTKREGDPESRDIVSLDTMISPTGSLSAGERQLVALARAILRRSQVIVMDEATSQIDVSLDDKIQRTIREELSSAMVITIAHRLKTIIDYDRILVLDDGRIVEFDTPNNLISREGGAFREMCRRSADWNDLRKSVSQS